MSIIRLPVAAAVVLFLGIAIPNGSCDGSLHVVGVLGNSAGLSDRPVPYAYYTGIGADGRGRLYLAGASQGIVVCDQDGACLAVLPLPAAEGMITQSLLARAGDALFFLAVHPGHTRSALYRVPTGNESAGALKCERVADGEGAWAVSPTLDAQGWFVDVSAAGSQYLYRLRL